MRSFPQLLESFETAFQKEVWTIQSTNPQQLYEPVAYSLVGGGKRIRPILLLHAASLFTEDYISAYPAAVAIELFHNFTLLHDDIMDHADIRRGEPSVHVKFGENSAILSGDAMSIMAFRYLSQCTDSQLKPLLSLFADTALEVCEGQQYDMQFEEKNQVPLDEYLEMIRLKTAVLIACSLKMGAIIGGADEESCELLYKFGINIGIAFQLQDDWLDVYGDEKTFGKQIGGDICENKKSCLLINALEMSNGEQSAILSDWLQKSHFDPKEKIHAVREIFTQTGASDATKRLMNHYHDLALHQLEQLKVVDSEKSQLRNFAAGVLSRIK